MINICHMINYGFYGFIIFYKDYSYICVDIFIIIYLHNNHKLLIFVYSLFKHKDIFILSVD